MPLPANIKKQVEETLTAYCESRVPAHVKNEVNYSYGFRGNSATLFENRPDWRNRNLWHPMAIAQFRFDPVKGLWTLYCADRNSKWHEYLEVEPTQQFQKLLDEVEDDPTGIFFG